LKVTHWQHPQFHGYFPAGNSYASLLGDLFASAMGCHGFSWVSIRVTAVEQQHDLQKASPVNTELEMLVVDWVGRMIGLPEQFLFTGKNSVGGGAIQVRE
jgi:glutamate/tyrosine decarboxylase-like PLP-dependent enzyme